jgi:hypothetical protein
VRLTSGTGARRGPGVSGGVQEGERRVRLSGNGVPRGGPARHSARRRGFKPDFKQNPNSKVQANFQTVIDRKSTFSASEKLK